MQDIKNTLVQIPWGVEGTWAILTPKNVASGSKIENIAPYLLKPKFKVENSNC